ncbi:hypothetical protein R4I97_02390 [Brachyspira pilosicoli]|uniref:hypothetical protein n=1 Tax=Brachyspira pilosicoli TaxID=52584 RepID=UPI003004B32F
MSKKFLSLISVLFLVTVLAVSCSNADKTGDGTQTAQGIAKHAGTWDFKEDSSTGGTGSGTITIKEDGSVNVNTKGVDFNGNNAMDKGNETYDVILTYSTSTLTLTLTLMFNSDNKTGSYSIDDGNKLHTGTITKQ